MTHSPFGTKGYIDPVAEATGIYDASSDIFSLARTINELLTGNRDGGVIRMMFLLNFNSFLTA